MEVSILKKYVSKLAVCMSTDPGGMIILSQKVKNGPARPYRQKQQEIVFSNDRAEVHDIAVDGTL